MKTTANSLKSTMLKKKLSNTISTSTNSQPLMNKTSSSLSNNEDKLAQLKQKLQKQRQNMRKSGRRFKQQSSSNEIEIQTNSQDIQVLKQKQVSIQTNNKKPTATSSTSSNLYSFQSLKTTAQNRANRMFLKRPSNKKSEVLPLAIEKSVKSIGLNNEKSLTKGEITRKKQTVNLMELSQVILNQKNIMKQPQTQPSTNKFVQINKNQKQHQNHFDNDILVNSRVFQFAIKQQKLRNKEVQLFLKKVGLQQFCQSFISLGFDQIDTLIQVQVDDLNSMMMRARQQQKLMSLIKAYKQQNGIQPQSQAQQQITSLRIKTSLASRPLTSHPKSSIPTQPSQNPTQSSRLLHSTFYNMSQSTLVNKSSVFYMMGGDEWSLESQVRKACSGCFKQGVQMERRGECYYCQQCDIGDQLDVSLNISMVRNYIH